MFPNIVVSQIAHKPNIRYHSSLKTIKASVGRFYKTKKNDKYTLHPLNTFCKTQRKKTTLHYFGHSHPENLQGILHLLSFLWIFYPALYQVIMTPEDWCYFRIQFLKYSKVHGSLNSSRVQIRYLIPKEEKHRRPIVFDLLEGSSEIKSENKKTKQWKCLLLVEQF